MAKRDDPIQAIEQLRCEEIFSGPPVNLILLTSTSSDPNLMKFLVSSQVGGQDDNHLAEVSHSTTPIAEPTIPQELQ
jgi:hypothetical protein